MLFISFHAPALNAWCLLLKHRGAFGASVIVVFESLSMKDASQNHTLTAGTGSR